MSLQKKKKAELIDIILRKDEVEVQLREQIKELNAQLDEVDAKFEHSLDKVCEQKHDINKQLAAAYDANSKLRKKIKLAKIASVAILVTAITIGVILLV